MPMHSGYHHSGPRPAREIAIEVFARASRDPANFQTFPTARAEHEPVADTTPIWLVWLRLVLGLDS
jgi:hypothetical protein